MSIRRRSRIDTMAPKSEPTWLVVDDRYGTPLHVQPLPPLTDPRIVMIEQMSKSIRLGFEVEELPGTLPIYFARKGEERNCVKIVERDPTATSSRSG